MAATSRTGGHEPSSDPGKRFRENPPDDDEVEEIEEERARRLAPENRPDGAEIDNTGDRMPEIARSDPDESAEGEAGHADPSQVFRENPPDDDEVEEIEEERDRRLAPENRPDGAEIDNTGREHAGLHQGGPRGLDRAPAARRRVPARPRAGASVPP